MASEVELSAGRDGVTVGGAAVSGATGSMRPGDSHRAAYAVVVFYSPYRCAVSAERGKSDSVLLGERFLETQPHRERVIWI